MKALVEHFFTGPTTHYTAYDSTKTTLGSLMCQMTGINPEDKWAGPLPVMVGRPMESSVPFPVLMPCAIRYNKDIHWLFAIEGITTASASRRVVMYEKSDTAGTLTWKGYITLTLPTATAHTVRGFRVARYLDTTGTVGVSGTAVTGSGTNWTTNRHAVGARIGFGSTDPSLITTWYQITAIGSNTGITIGASAGTIASGTPYVLEELRFIYVSSNATATSSGVYIAKGCNVGIFLPGGTTIPAATTVDNIRACYWLKDASTQTNTIPIGCGNVTMASFTQDDLIVMDLPAATTPKLYKYNMRAALTVASGASVNAWTLTTGVQTVTGTMVVTNSNNGRCGTLNHGPAAGVESFFFTTPSRVYRVALGNITSGSTTWISDQMTEVPPGGTNTYLPTLGTLASVEIADSLDKLIVCTTGAAGCAGIYITQYRTDGGQMDHCILRGDWKNMAGSAADARVPVSPSFTTLPLWVWSENGQTYMIRSHATTAGTAVNNQIYAVPLAADWTYAEATNNRLVSPQISIPNAAKHYAAHVRAVPHLGEEPFTTELGAYRVYARTGGITDNSGGWTLLNKAGDLSALAVTGTIQFMFEFKLLTQGALIPARIMSVGVSYETNEALLSQFQWSLEDSSLSDGTFGFSQINLFGSSVPGLTINYYRSDTNALLLTQASSGTTNGVFEYWSGSAWSAGLGTDTVGLRRRFRPTAGLPAGIEVYARISLT